MTYTPEILEDIELDAVHGFSMAEIAFRLGITYEKFVKDYNNKDLQVKLYFDAGRSKGKVQTDNTLYELAKSGSSTAKKAYDQKLKEAKLSDELREIFKR